MFSFDDNSNVSNVLTENRWKIWKLKKTTKNNITSIDFAGKFYSLGSINDKDEHSVKQASVA